MEIVRAMHSSMRWVIESSASLLVPLAVSLILFPFFALGYIGVLAIAPPVIVVVTVTALKVFDEHSAYTDDDDMTFSEKTVTEEKIVPYDTWPDTCYACQSEIHESMERRGQFVVHGSESADDTKAVGLCEECVWTYSTLLDNHDRLVEAYDDRKRETRL